MSVATAYAPATPRVLKLTAMVVASVRSCLPNHIAESKGGVLMKKGWPSEATVWPKSTMEKVASGMWMYSAAECAHTRMTAPTVWAHTPTRKHRRRPYTESRREEGKTRIM